MVHGIWYRVAAHLVDGEACLTCNDRRNPGLTVVVLRVPCEESGVQGTWYMVGTWYMGTGPVTRSRSSLVPYEE